MRWLLMVFCFVASSGWASVIPLNPPVNITLGAAGYVTNGPVVMNSAAQAIEMRAAVGWGTVAFPATMTIGEGAAAVALAVLRATPAIATASALAYLAQIGIRKCLDGTWCTSQKSPSAGDTGFDGWAWGYGDGNGNTFYAGSPYSACKSSGIVSTGEATFVSMSQSSDSSYSCVGRRVSDGSPAYWSTSRASFCVKNYVQTAGACVPDPGAPGVAPTDDDWNKGLTYPVTIGLASDLAAAKVPVPVNITLTPDPSTGRPAPKTVNLSDPYVDPVTGKRYRDIAVITPNADGRTATLTTAKQEVDANGNPVTDPNTGGGKAPEPQTDPCSGHETRMDCVEQGQVPDGPDLKEQKINVAITPDAGWGPDTGSCPVDIPLSYMGHSFGMSWSGICSFASMIRPIVLAMAWLGAALIVVGASKQGGD
jgi:hypothetical protein